MVDGAFSGFDRESSREGLSPQASNVPSQVDRDEEEEVDVTFEEPNASDEDRLKEVVSQGSYGSPKHKDVPVTHGPEVIFGFFPLYIALGFFFATTTCSSWQDDNVRVVLCDAGPRGGGMSYYLSRPGSKRCARKTETDDLVKGKNKSLRLTRLRRI